MQKDSDYYKKLLAFAHACAGSYALLAKAMGASSGPAAQMWRVNGVPHKWRPVLDEKFGRQYRKKLKHEHDVVM